MKLVRWLIVALCVCSCAIAKPQAAPPTNTAQQIAQLQAQVATLQNQVLDLQQRVGTLENSVLVSGLQHQIDELKTRVATLEQGNQNPPPPPPPSNLVADPQFDHGVSDFAAQDSSSFVTQSSVSPLEGGFSLRVSIAGYGNSIWWVHSVTGTLASDLTVAAHLRSDVASSSIFQLCAMAYYTDGATALFCSDVSGSVGDKGVVTTRLTLDATKPLDTVRIRLIQQGSAPLAFTLDAAFASLTVVGSSAGGGGSPPPMACASPPSSAYPGFTYHLPTVRPFISLAQYASADTTGVAYTRLKAAADAALVGQPPYGYSARDSVIVYRLSGSTSYLDDAIGRVETMVVGAEAASTAGNVPVIAADSYLDVGPSLEQLALAYDYGYARLTPEQRQRWASFAEQTLSNLWHPTDATWGGVAHPWSGWSLCDPGNNYHFSFLRATMLWALASQNQAWFTFLQTQKFEPLIEYYAQLPGGGSREGTGYGTAQKALFENYLYWGNSTGEHLESLTSHTRETIDYWVHATVPTLDRFAPIGDQSRVSIPDLYDYQENLVHEAVVLSPSTSEAQRGTWWLQHNSVNGVSSSFNLYGDLLPLPDQGVAPTDLVYHAQGAGVVFARSSWSADAAWLSFVAGKYDQSHAHQDQGAFTFFQNDWLAVTQNIWSHSGIHQETDLQNAVRFERADGSLVPQSQSDTLASTMTVTRNAGSVSITADLSNAYWRDSASVQSWTRHLDFIGTTLRVTDACQIGSGIKPVFQVQVPTAPTLLPNGSISTGHLLIVPLSSVTATWTPMPAPEFSRGYRIDLASTVCAFTIELRVQ